MVSDGAFNAFHFEERERKTESPFLRQDIYLALEFAKSDSRCGDIVHAD